MSKLSLDLLEQIIFEEAESVLSEAEYHDGFEKYFSNKDIYQEASGILTEEEIYNFLQEEAENILQEKWTDYLSKFGGDVAKDVGRAISNPFKKAGNYLKQKHQQAGDYSIQKDVETLNKKIEQRIQGIQSQVAKVDQRMNSLKGRPDAVDQLNKLSMEKRRLMTRMQQLSSQKNKMGAFAQQAAQKQLPAQAPPSQPQQHPNQINLDNIMNAFAQVTSRRPNESDEEYGARVNSEKGQQLIRMARELNKNWSRQRDGEDPTQYRQRTQPITKGLEDYYTFASQTKKAEPEPQPEPQVEPKVEPEMEPQVEPQPEPEEVPPPPPKNPPVRPQQPTNVVPLKKQSPSAPSPDVAKAAQGTVDNGEFDGVAVPGEPESPIEKAVNKLKGVKNKVRKATPQTAPATLDTKVQSAPPEEPSEPVQATPDALASVPDAGAEPTQDSDVESVEQLSDEDLASLFGNSSSKRFSTLAKNSDVDEETLRQQLDAMVDSGKLEKSSSGLTYKKSTGKTDSTESSQEKATTKKPKEKTKKAPQEEEPKKEKTKKSKAKKSKGKKETPSEEKPKRTIKTTRKKKEKSPEEAAAVEKAKAVMAKDSETQREIDKILSKPSAPEPQPEPQPEPVTKTDAKPSDATGKGAGGTLGLDYSEDFGVESGQIDKLKKIGVYDKIQSELNKGDSQSYNSIAKMFGKKMSRKEAAKFLKNRTNAIKVSSILKKSGKDALESIGLSSIGPNTIAGAKDIRKLLDYLGYESETQKEHRETNITIIKESFSRLLKCLT